MTTRARPRKPSVLRHLHWGLTFAIKYLSVRLEEIDQGGGEERFHACASSPEVWREGGMNLSKNTGLAGPAAPDLYAQAGGGKN